ncbi:hypothetical protein R84B8_01832 [Treponema sp. R8-4-B8]
MEINDMEALIKITKEIEAQGYTLKSVKSKKMCIGTPTLDIKLVLSRERIAPEYGNPPEHVI